MGQTYQDKWMSVLPWALLGLRSSFNQDLGTSSAELSFGFHPQLPGSVLTDPGQAEDFDGHVEGILQRLRVLNDKTAIPTSFNRPNPKVDSLPDNITHVYAKEYDVKGLGQKFRGPFKVTSRPSRSTIEIKVGSNRDGSDRLELRHVSDTKIAYLRDDAKEASRPKRGRPPKDSSKTPSSTSSNETAQAFDEKVNKDVATEETTTTRNLEQAAPAPYYNLRPRRNKVAAIDFTKPPPNFKHPNPSGDSTAAEPTPMWTATPFDLSVINQSISSRARGTG